MRLLFICSKGRSFNRDVAGGVSVPLPPVSFCGCALWRAEARSPSSAVFCRVPTPCCSKPGLCISSVALVQPTSSCTMKVHEFALKNLQTPTPSQGFLPLYEHLTFEAERLRALLRRKGRHSDLRACRGDASIVLVCFAGGSAVGAGAERRLGHSAHRLHARG